MYPNQGVSQAGMPYVNQAGMPYYGYPGVQPQAQQPQQAVYPAQGMPQSPQLYPVFQPTQPYPTYVSLPSSSGTSSTATSNSTSPTCQVLQELFTQTNADLVKHCMNLQDNRSYQDFSRLPTIQLDEKKLQSIQRSAINGVLPKFLAGVEMVSDFVAQTALKCAFLSLLILSAGVLIAGALSAFYLVTLLPVALGFTVLGMIAKIIAALANRLKEASINASFSSSLSKEDKKNLEAVKEWNAFNKKELTHLKVELEYLTKFIEWQIPQDKKEEYLKQVQTRMKNQLTSIATFKLIKEQLASPTLSFTNRYLGFV